MTRHATTSLTILGLAMLFWLSAYNFFSVAVQDEQKNQIVVASRPQFPIVGAVGISPTFNKPAIFYVYEPIEIKMIVTDIPPSASIDKQDTADLFVSMVSGKKRMSNYVSADITGPPSGIEIKAGGNPMQKVDKSTDPSFVWYLTPQIIGDIPIEVSLYAKKTADDDAVAQVFTIFEGRIHAEARGLNFLKYELQHLQPIQTAVITLFSSIGAILTFFGVKSLFPRAKSEDFIS